jgi:hypothetical protein
MWEYDIEMGVIEIGLEGVERIHLTQDRDDRQALENMAINVYCY